MVEFFSTMIERAPELVQTPLGVAGLLIIVSAYLVAFWKKARFDSLIKRIEHLPKEDRVEALKSEMGSIPLPANFSPSDWISAQRQKYFFGAYVITALFFLILISMSFFLSASTNVRVDGDGNRLLLNSNVNTGND